MVSIPGDHTVIPYTGADECYRYGRHFVRRFDLFVTSLQGAVPSHSGGSARSKNWMVLYICPASGVTITSYKRQQCTREPTKEVVSGDFPDLITLETLHEDLPNQRRSSEQHRANTGNRYHETFALRFARPGADRAHVGTR